MSTTVESSSGSKDCHDLQDESEFLKTVESYMLDEFGFKSLEELDLFYNGLLTDAKKDNDVCLQRKVVAYWERCSLEFIGFRETVVKNLDNIRRSQVRPQEYKISSSNDQCFTY